MDTKQKVGISALTVYGVLLVAIFFWWLVVCCFMPVKVTNTTININNQKITTTDALGNPVEDERSLFEVNIYDNFFEIVINSIWDENKNAFSSYCIQYVANSALVDNGRSTNSAFAAKVYSSLYNKNIEYSNFTEVYKKEINQWDENVKNYILWDQKDVIKERDIIYSYDIFKNATCCTYSGVSNGTEIKWTKDDTVLDTLNLTKSFMLIEVGDELFGMTPKGINIDRKTHSGEFFLETYKHEGDFYPGKYDTAYYQDNKFIACDINYIIKNIYDKVASLNSGTDGEFSIKLGDYFNYKYNSGNYVYKDLLPGDSKYANVLNKVQTSVNIKAKRSEGKATSANNSLINFFKDQENYGVTEDNTFDYSGSANIYEVTNSDFVFDNGTLTLCEKFVNYFSDYSNKMRLKVELDLTNYKYMGYENIKINTGKFLVYRLNDIELNARLEDYNLEVI